MGIRFHCHHCHYELHVKDFQAGKRGRCPECQGKFRIPLSDAELSLEVEQATNQLAVASTHPAATAKLHGQETKPSDSKRTDAKSSESKRTESKHSDLSPSDSRRGTAELVETKQATTVPQASADPIGGQVAKKITTNTKAQPTPDSASDSQRLPRAIVEYPAGTWHVRPTAGGQYGPAPADTMGQWLIEGRVARDALVWRDDWAEWLSAEHAFEDYFSIESAKRPPATGQPPIDASEGSSLIDSPPESISAIAQPILTTAVRSRLERKHKKRQRYIVIVSILTVLFIALLIALAAVLFWPE